MKGELWPKQTQHTLFSIRRAILALLFGRMAGQYIIPPVQMAVIFAHGTIALYCGFAVDVIDIT
ncbi:Uncharacterised protein [[Flavobacterium] thermophilum]|nr:Uncharacterised protein [[Flavobacterium] thermophilum]